MKTEELRKEIEEADNLDDLSTEAKKQAKLLVRIFKSWLELKKLTSDLYVDDTKIKHEKTPLQQMLDEQADLDQRIREEKNINFGYKVNELSSLCTAISNETEELRDTAAWKWWSEDMGADWDAARAELVDILHFWLSAANLLGMDAEDIYSEYMEKNEVNHDRQDGGY